FRICVLTSSELKSQRSSKGAAAVHLIVQHSTTTPALALRALLVCWPCIDRRSAWLPRQHSISRTDGAIRSCFQNRHPVLIQTFEHGNEFGRGIIVIPVHQRQADKPIDH